ncbi:sulfide-quinone oxidoreductase [Armillaria mellea]|nr:sulfide-quinone oxidoreductase [Armillaria mellea]
MLTVRRLVCSTKWSRLSSTSASGDKYKVVVVGAGSAGLSVANQVYNRFKSAGKPLNSGDVAIIDSAEFHYYQCLTSTRTLVGAGLKQKTEFRRPLASLIPKHLTHVNENVKSFSPETSSVTTASGRSLTYETLVVATGLQINWDGIQGLPKALSDSTSGVSSIYSYDTCDKVWADIESLRSGNAVFTQPAGVVKCAGAPQKIMWMAWDRFRKTGRRENIKIDFYTGMPTMFSVKKYSDALNALRVERNVGGHFQHNLVAIDSANHKATFAKSDGSKVDVDYTMLHVTPPMGPLDFLKGSPIADSAGWVTVDQDTLQHTKPDLKLPRRLPHKPPFLPKISSLSWTQARLAMQDMMVTPAVRCVVSILVSLLTGYGELMLAEFKYGLELKETFSSFVDQSKSRRLFYHLKKDIFPASYWNFMVRGQWFGTRGIFRPRF